MTSEFSEREECPPAFTAEHDPSIPHDGWGQEVGPLAEQAPEVVGDSADARPERKLGELAVAGAADGDDLDVGKLDERNGHLLDASVIADAERDEWSDLSQPPEDGAQQSAPEDDRPHVLHAVPESRGTLDDTPSFPEHKLDEPKLDRRAGGDTAHDDGWEEYAQGWDEGERSAELREDRAGPPDALTDSASASEFGPWLLDGDIPRVTAPRDDGRGETGDGGRDLVSSRSPTGDGDSPRSAFEKTSELPLPLDLVAERTTRNRIDLADNVRAIEFKPTYDGYLDVVMHGDEAGTQAYVRDQPVDFTLSETAEMISATPGWDGRPIRLMSCSTGRDSYAQELSDRLKVPVYAPNGTLHVLPDGETFVEAPDDVTEGAWRRFEPRASAGG